MVRLGATRADICARFSLADTPSARQWLENNHLDDNNECLLRRAIGADGRSRGFINGTPVPVSQLRELGQHLIQIHGQHAHQLLLKPDHQKTIIGCLRKSIISVGRNEGSLSNLASKLP